MLGCQAAGETDCARDVVNERDDQQSSASFEQELKKLKKLKKGRMEKEGDI